jgi:hypothetical protein
MERCPICRARFKDEPICYRCGADLSSLLAIEAEAATLEEQAVALTDAGQWLDARQAAEQALALQYRPLAFAVREFARRELIAGETRRLERLLR